jgi:hypothetical protein
MTLASRDDGRPHHSFDGNAAWVRLKKPPSINDAHVNPLRTMLPSNLSLAIALVVIPSLGIGLISLSSAKKKVAVLPPGPKGWPLIGNVLGIPSTFQWKTYRQWSIQYGA